MFYSYSNATIMSDCCSQSAVRSIMSNIVTESYSYKNESCQHAKDGTVNQSKRIRKRRQEKRGEKKSQKKRESRTNN